MPTFALYNDADNGKMDVKRDLLTDIELDVKVLRCLMDSFSKAPTASSSELVERSIQRMYKHLDELSEAVSSADFRDATVKVEEKNEPVAEINHSERLKDIGTDNCTTVLGERIKLTAGLRQAISLNDSFRFAHDVFGSDTDLMNRIIEQISVMSSYELAVAFLSSKVKLDRENETANDFLELLKRYFN